MKKLNWKKLLNPNDIDLEKLSMMSNVEFKLFVADLSKSELIKLWITYAYFLNYICITNSWQYILAYYLSKY